MVALISDTLLQLVQCDKGHRRTFQFTRSTLVSSGLLPGSGVIYVYTHQKVITSRTAFLSLQKVI